MVWGASIENAELGYAVGKAAKVTIWQSLWGECQESLSGDYRGGGCRGRQFGEERAQNIWEGVQWLGPGVFTATALGSVRGQGTKIPQTTTTIATNNIDSSTARRQGPQGPACSHSGQKLV